MRPFAPSRAFTLVLLAAVLAAKLLMPAGWMPQAQARGITMVLCSGDGPSEGWVDPAGKFHLGKAPGDKQPGDTSGKAKDACPYGALAAPAQLPLAAALPQLAPAGAEPPRLARAAVAIGQGLAAPPPPQTGPPLNA